MVVQEVVLGGWNDQGTNLEAPCSGLHFVNTRMIECYQLHFERRKRILAYKSENFGL